MGAKKQALYAATVQQIFRNAPTASTDAWTHDQLAALFATDTWLYEHRTNPETTAVAYRQRCMELLQQFKGEKHHES